MGRCGTGVCLLWVCLAILACTCTAQTTAPPADAGVLQLDWHVTVGVGAPDCFQRNVLLVNNTFQPTIEVVQGSLLQITVHNDLPSDYPDLSGGLSLHWHGFNMRGREWYDGTAYASQCPIPKGQSFTYSFIVDEQVGTYLWHDHSQMYRADGLQGALIVLPRPGRSEGWEYDAEHTLVVADWFHGEAAALGMDLQRPFDLNRTTPTSGHWRWVGLPQALLVNGRGFYGDCALIGGLGDVAGQATKPTTCNVTSYTVPGGVSVQQPWASKNNPGCSHANVTVEQGATIRFRLINPSILAYITVCFEGHNVTTVAADAVPVEPISFGSCVDLGSGQRLDVLLTADQPVDNYWISLTQQYRIGAPMGFAVLHYNGSAANTLPHNGTSNPQPTTALPYSADQINEVVINEALLGKGPQDTSAVDLVANAVIPGNATKAEVPSVASQEVVLHITQPLLQSTGQIRWALNNVAQPSSPPCTNLLQELYDRPTWLQEHAAANSFSSDTLAGVQNGTGAELKVFMADAPMPENPSVGLHALQLQMGDVVDIILQNTPSASFNGDYRGPAAAASRSSTEMHPFHLHGHHFWLLATGQGVWNASEDPASYNLDNPPLRDTAILLPNGWTALRFVADNPGVWLLHCHQTVHFVIGQALYIAEAVDQISKPPSDIPQCPSTCTYSEGLLSQPLVAARYGASGFETADEVLVG